MHGERLPAQSSTDHDNAIQDVLAGKERILPLGAWHTALPQQLHPLTLTSALSSSPCRTPSACRFAALNFVRVAFGHVERVRRVERAKGRGHAGAGPNVNIGLWLKGIMGKHVLEEVLAPCEQLTGKRAIQLEEMCRIPLFEGALTHVVTKHGSPSMIFFKQSLRQMQLHASPVSAMVISRNASTTVCLKFWEASKNVFLVLDFALASPKNSPGLSATTPALALVISTSLERTAARLSGILPVDNHLVTRDKQWQAQLFANCTICMFTPVRGASLVLLVAGSSAVNEGIALLRVMGEVDDQGRGPESERDTRNQERRESDRPSGSSHGQPWERTPFDTGRAAPTGAGRSETGFLGEGSSARIADLRLQTTFIPYEQTKRYCRIFFLDDDESTAATSPVPSTFERSPEGSDEEAYFECGICFEDIPEEKWIRLSPCAHGLCRGCLAGHVCSKIEERKFPVLCPLCMVEQGNASPSVVSGTSVQQLGVSEAQYAIWSELEMADLCVWVHCRRCNRSALVDKEDYEHLEELHCPLPGCRHTWCKNCQQSLSEKGPKHSCDGTEELNHLVKQMRWKYCPKCRTPVQKNGGCNHMTCAAPGCNTHFCYECGKQITRASSPFLVVAAVNAHFQQCSL